MPGTLVLRGLKAPRYSSGASGFMSNVSRWLGPPPAQRRITEKSRSTPGDVDAAARTSASRTGNPPARAPMERAPILRKPRRDCGPGQDIMTDSASQDVEELFGVE